MIPAVDLVPDWPSASAPVLVKLGVDRAVELARGGPVEEPGPERPAGGAGGPARDGRNAPASEPRRVAQSPLGADVKEAFLSLHIGRPLLGQRVIDLLCLLQSLRSEPDLPATSGFELTGTGAAGPVVLHAAALDETGLDPPGRPGAKPGVLGRRGRARDQPGTARQCGPGRAEILRPSRPGRAAGALPAGDPSVPTNAVGQPVSQKELEAAYAPAIQAYGTGGELVLRAGP